MQLFSENHFYHEETKRLITALGQLFSGIRIEKLDSTGKHIAAYDVPVAFGPKNKWISMIRERNNLDTQQVQITLPRMSFEIVGMTYAPQRKIGMFRSYAVAGRTKIFSPAPYDVQVALHVMTKDQNDNLQVVEQILPYFQPLLNINFEILPEFKVNKDVPIILNQTTTEDNYEGGTDTQRVVTTTFSLTAQMLFFGKTDTSKAVIKDVKVSINSNGNLAKFEAKVNPLSANKQDQHTITEAWKEM